MDETFIGAMSERAFYIQAIRAAFSEDYCDFSICHLHHLPKYDHRTFANWVRALHCQKHIAKASLEMAKAYCVNYFLCPDSSDEFEVEAYMREVFPVDCPTGRYKVVASLFGYELRRKVVE